VLPGVVLLPVLVPTVLPFELVHESRERVFMEGFDKVAMGMREEDARGLLGKPVTEYGRETSSYKVWVCRDNHGVGLANGKVIWKMDTFALPDYGVVTKMGRVN
jgi:hypothetical protein